MSRNTSCGSPKCTYLSGSIRVCVCVCVNTHYSNALLMMLKQQLSVGLAEFPAVSKQMEKSEQPLDISH